MSLLKAAFCAAEPSQRHRRRRWRLLTLITRTAGLCRSTNALTAARGVPYGSSRCRGEEEGAAATPAAATVRVSVPSFSAAGLPSFKGVVTPSDAARILSQALRAQEGRRQDALGASGALDAGQLDALVEDVARLVGLFAKVSGEEHVFVRLEALEDNGCVFWHQDCVDFRLCATYRGPCTEFVAPEWSKAVLRRRQADSKHAQSLMHTDVALFKGRGEDHDATKLLDHPGIVHRSPRIEAAGICRSVLVLDIPQPWMMQDEDDSHDEDDEEDGEEEEGEEESEEDDEHHH